MMRTETRIRLNLSAYIVVLSLAFSPRTPGGYVLQSPRYITRGGGDV